MTQPTLVHCIGRAQPEDPGGRLSLEVGAVRLQLKHFPPDTCQLLAGSAWLPVLYTSVMLQSGGRATLRGAYRSRLIMYRPSALS